MSLLDGIRSSTSASQPWNVIIWEHVSAAALLFLFFPLPATARNLLRASRKAFFFPPLLLIHKSQRREDDLCLIQCVSRLQLAGLATQTVASFHPIWTSLPAPLEQTQLGDTVYSLVYSRNTRPTRAHWETSGQSSKHGLSRQRGLPNFFRRSQIRPISRWLYFILDSRGAAAHI